VSVRTYALPPEAVDVSGFVHRPAISRTSRDGHNLHTMACSCGLEGGARTVGRLAVKDRLTHLMQVSAAPADERCQQPRAHRVRPWDACPLCAGQLDLFDLTTDLTGLEAS
jgi:hypothetical protein